MSSMSLAEYRRLFPVKTKKRRSAKQGTRQPSGGELITFTKILVEIEGGIWMVGGGRDIRGKSYIGDMEKYNSAAMMGFTVLRFSTEQVKSGLAVQQIEKMVGRNE